MKDQSLLLTANTHNVIVVAADLNQAGNKLLLSDVSSVYSSLTPCLNWRQISSRDTLLACLSDNVEHIILFRFDMIRVNKLVECP